MGTDDASLLDLLRQFHASTEEKHQIRQLIQQLGSNQYRQRERAGLALVQHGPRALPPLRTAAQEGNLETSQRALACIEQIERRFTPAVQRACLNLLLARKPEGAEQAIWDFLPYAAEESVRDLAGRTLALLLQSHPQQTAILKGGFQDAASSRRAVTGLILGKVGSSLERQKVRQLLTDPDPTVRLWAARGLLAGEDATALPALIRLLEEGPIDIAFQAEELLRLAAGEQAPRALLGSEQANRKRCALAWNDWVQGNSDSIQWKSLAASWLERTPRTVAQSTAQAFAEALRRGNVEQLRNLTSVPFVVGRLAPIRTQAELEQIFQAAATEMKRRSPRVVLLEILPARDYALRFEPNLRLALLQQPRIWVVLVESRYDDSQVDLGAVLIEVTGSTARVVGVMDGKRDSSQR